MSKSGSLKKKRIFFRVYLSQAYAQELKVLRTAINCTCKAPVLQQGLCFLREWFCYPGGWCHLRCPWAAVLAFRCHSRWAQISHRSRVTPASLNRPLKWSRISPMEWDNPAWITELHPTRLHPHLMQCYPKRCHVPLSLGCALLQTPTEKCVSPSEKKTVLR